MGNIKGKTPEAPPEADEKAKKPKPPRPETIPDFRDKDGQLLKLRNRDFPGTKEGRMAFCDFQIARWEARKVRVTEQADPKQRKLKKIEKLKAMLLKLQAEVAEEAPATAK